MEILALSIIAGIFALDVTAFGQIMISRPIVCGPIFGYLIGDIYSGFWIGMIVELIWINAIPMGTSIPQDVTAITILSCVWGKYLGDSRSAVIFAVALAIPLGFLFKYFDVRLRYYNSAISRWIEAGINGGKENRIDYGIYLGLLLFFLKAVVFYALFIYLGKVFALKLYALMPNDLKAGFEMAWYILPMIGFGVVFLNACYKKFSCVK